jgi:GxxExxY protein
MLDNQNQEEELAHLIIGKAIDIHKILGPGLDKQTYIDCLKYELEQDGLNYEQNKSIDFQYKSISLNNVYTIDFVISSQVVIEVATSADITEVEIQRLLKMIRVNDYKLGLIINFNSTLLKNGIRRVSNNKTV